MMFEPINAAAIVAGALTRARWSASEYDIVRPRPDPSRARTTSTGQLRVDRIEGGGLGQQEGFDPLQTAVLQQPYRRGGSVRGRRSGVDASE